MRQSKRVVPGNALRLLLGALLAVAALAGTGCTAFQVANAVSPPVSTTSIKNVAYGPLPRQKLDVYRGRGISPATSVPTVVFFYGGGWSSGERGDYAFLARAIAEEGFVVVVPDYRTYPTGVFPDFPFDAALAVKWAHDHAADLGGDPARLYVAGQSAGAHIAALVALDPRYLATVGLTPATLCGLIGLSGPYWFVPRPIDRRPLGLPADLAPADLAPADLAPADPARLTPASLTPASLTPADFDPKLQPLAQVTPAARSLRVLLLHGQADTIVRPDNSARLADALTRAGADVTLHTYPNVGHTETASAFLWPLRAQAPIRRDVIRFLRLPP